MHPSLRLTPHPSQPVSFGVAYVVVVLLEPLHGLGVSGVALIPAAGRHLIRVQYHQTPSIGDLHLVVGSVRVAVECHVAEQTLHPLLTRQVVEFVIAQQRVERACEAVELLHHQPQGPLGGMLLPSHLFEALVLAVNQVTQLYDAVERAFVPLVDGLLEQFQRLAVVSLARPGKVPAVVVIGILDISDDSKRERAPLRRHLQHRRLGEGSGDR
mmetsp:Transcript_8020/g.22788  ORF Transcript_8020/g.22788 Transcript_8020/m.22788 type:complete len:213 (+) Transcript_8020:2636-3274(+)